MDSSTKVPDFSFIIGENKLVQLGGDFSNSSALPLLLSELEDWEAVLKAEPDVIHKLQALDAAVNDEPSPVNPRQTAALSNRPRLQGPTR